MSDHPANARVFFYGDDDLEARLSLLDDYLKDFDAADATPSTSEVATQKLLGSPRRLVEAYPVAPDEAEPKHMVLLSWLLHEEPLPPEEELALGVLDHLLMGTPTSTLYKAMIESNLGSALMGGGVQDELKQATFSVGLKGVKADDVGKVEDLAISTLAKAAADGFDADAIEASLNTLEFSLREFNTGGFPKGLSLMLAVMPRWLYGHGSPTDALRFEQPLASLKRRLASGEKVFEELLTRLVVENPHLATVELKPDAQMAERELRGEEAVLAQAKAKMSSADVERVIESTRELKAAQLREDTAEQLASIPRVGLADLERDVKLDPTSVQPLDGGGTMLTHPLPTAGVVYADVLLDMSRLPVEDLPVLRFLTNMLDEVGTSELDATAMQRRIGARTGGIAPAMLYEQPVGETVGTVGDPSQIVAHFALRGKATVEKAPQLFELLHDLLTDANLAGGQAKAVEMLRESEARLEAAFIESGNTFAGSRLSARNSLLGYVGEATQGYSYYLEVKHMLAQATDDWPALLARLEGVRDALLSQDGLVINLTADQAALDKVAPIASGFAARLPATPARAAGAPWKEAVELLPRVDEGYAITTQVNYVAAGGLLFEKDEPMDGAYYAVARCLSRGFLWDNVRVVGGAYGGGCSLNPSTGAFAFSSYRDPNLQGTLDTYGRSSDVLDELSASITDEALEQAIVGAVGDLDSPMTSQQRGFRALTHYLTGVTTEQRQLFRDQVIGTSRESFAAFASKLRDAEVRVAVFGSKEALEKANAQRGADEQISVTPV